MQRTIVRAPLPSMSHPSSLTPRAVGWATFALAVGGFAIGTGEFAMMGLMPDVSTDLNVSEPQVGHLISAYAMGVVVGAPLLAVLGARLPRRRLLLLLMLMFALGNVASVLVPGYLLVLLMRFVSGLPHGAYFGVAALVAASMVAPNRRGQAVGRVMLGLTVAALIGNPIATWAGQWLGWRAAYAGVGAMGVLTWLLVRAWVPEPTNIKISSPMQELGALRSEQVWLTLAIGAVGFGGMFAVFSYVAPTLSEVTGLAAHWVPIALTVFGAGMVIGNVAGGWLADRALMPAVAIVLAWTILVLALFPFTAPYPVLVFINILFVGTTVALANPLQIRLMDVAADAQTLAASLNHSAFNIANAIGAWLGGMAISAGYGWTSTAWVGVGLACGGMAVFGLALWRMSRQPRVRSLSRPARG